jgi:hypothetical protein
MEPFLVLSDSDIFESPHPKPRFYTVRRAVTGVVRDQEGKIALFKKDGLGFFPSIVVPKNHDELHVFAELCQKALGCDVTGRLVLGRVTQKRHMTAKYYDIFVIVADLAGEKKHIPPDEEMGELVWMDEHELQELLVAQVVSLPKEDVYAPHFNSRMCLKILEGYSAIEK